MLIDGISCGAESEVVAVSCSSTVNVSLARTEVASMDLLEDVLVALAMAPPLKPKEYFGILGIATLSPASVTAATEDRSFRRGCVNGKAKLRDANRDAVMARVICIVVKK